MGGKSLRPANGHAASSSRGLHVGGARDCCRKGVRYAAWPLMEPTFDRLDPSFGRTGASPFCCRAKLTQLVWSGRASQEVFVELSVVRSCINVSGLSLERVLRATMDMSAPAFSLPAKPQVGYLGYQCSQAAPRGLENQVRRGSLSQPLAPLEIHFGLPKWLAAGRLARAWCGRRRMSDALLRIHVAQRRMWL